MEQAKRELDLFEIVHLISLHQEGGYWDFKKQWYSNKTDMLHDIICMANNLCNHTAYIIIGIDEENDYSAVDVSDDPNRRNTQKIVDFLKDKKFAGGIRPVVSVENFSYCGKTVDVVVVRNDCHTPFYLTTQYERVRANNIYTRVMDTNTPADGTADINHVEQLWRKRFHLDDVPIEKFRYYLSNPSAWKEIPDHDMGYFYKYSPEYTITCEADEIASGYEYYMFGQVDMTPSWWRVTLKYHQTAIAQFQGISLDGGRSFVIAPDRADDFLNMDISRFGYYIRNDLRFQLLEFYCHKETTEAYSYGSYMKAVAVFKSRREYRLFLDYAKTNMAEYHGFCDHWECPGLPNFHDIPGYNMEEFQKEYKDALVMKKMLAQFRRQEKEVLGEESDNANT